MTDLKGSQKYELAGRDEIALRNEIRDHSGRAFLIRQRFFYNAARARWSTNLQDGQFVGSAGEWLDLDQPWIFEGALRGTQGPVRMIYTNLGEVAFRRDFQKKADGRWQTLDLETCKRTSGR